VCDLRGNINDYYTQQKIKTEQDIKRYTNIHEIKKDELKLFELDKTERLTKLREEKLNNACNYNEYKVKKQDLEAKIKEAESTLETQCSFETLKQAKDEIFEKLRKVSVLDKEIKQELHMAKYKLDDVEKRINTLKPPKTHCNICGGSLSAETIDRLQQTYTEETIVLKEKHTSLLDKIVVFRKEIEELNIKRLALTEEEEILITTIDLTRKTLEELSKLQFQLSHITVDLEKLKTQEAKFIKAIEDVKNITFKSAVPQSEEELETLIQKGTQSVIDLEHQIVKLSKDIDNYIFWAKKGFSASGLKSFLYSSYIEKLNQAISVYANQFGAMVEMSISLETTRKTIKIKCMLDGIVKDYPLLSGGEKTTIDIAIIFGIIDVLKNINGKQVCNLLMLDEVFAGLDTSNLQIALDIIRTFGQSVYLTSQYNFDDIYGINRLEITKDKEGVYVTEI
jgi:DNA repair exonuclease SbcCD ATPase subunit